MHGSFVWVFLLFGAAVGAFVDPRKSGRNRLVYWLSPPIVAFAGYLVMHRSPGGALAFGAVALVLMGVTWLRYYRPGPGIFNK
ncbi:MAG: hypothetical protein FGM52_09465 [Mycobacterium sp.]|nr:hypothetical protein [Mycobacterium sp.]